jgi:hypothetical protein
MSKAGLGKVVRRVAKKQAQKSWALTKKQVRRFKALAKNETNSDRRNHYMDMAAHTAVMGEDSVERLLLTADQAAKAVATKKRH